MDDFTAGHMAAWIARTFRPEEFASVYGAMSRFVAEHGLGETESNPAGNTWPEIYALATRIL